MIYTCGEQLDSKIIYCVPWLRVLTDRRFQIEISVVIHYEIQTLFFRNYQPNFLLEVLNRQTISCAGVLD